MLLARVGVLKGGVFSRVEAAGTSSGPPPDTRHNTSTWDGRQVRCIFAKEGQQAVRERLVSHLEYLQQHVGPRPLAERLVVDAAVIRAALVRVFWLRE